VSTGKEF